MMNLFEMFAEETKDFEKEQLELAEKKKKENAVNTNTKVSDKKEKTKSSKPSTKVDPNKSTEEEIKKYPKIVVKAYGTELIQVEGETEVQAIKLSEISDRLINEFQYNEFSAGIRWHLVPNQDKTVGYLVATGQFYAKG
ncbi:hypothetical protein FDB37_15835 [Clostridium botulinum]|uniref:Uncharacterized protein n=2 Tax=Clostridium botulinum TaxID=1491 RepID=A0A126JIY4_CLOBO|nr:hypothetical protein [Clostridium botulinum]ALT05655.1 hypothetical protein [Clostridium botulinum]ALT05757.1 hypothetical protein [Clostridium botulinum]ALT05859.1 hypothetical protein [Clostridium botulinum]MBN1050355.1 hypothetical protein [Clostridium botulinum]NFI52281.1 hypothetical protein [Clostridium botulinum]